jgi:hypothetical protein
MANIHTLVDTRDAFGPFTALAGDRHPQDFCRRNIQDRLHNTRNDRILSRQPSIERDIDFLVAALQMAGVALQIALKGEAGAFTEQVSLSLDLINGNRVPILEETNEAEHGTD